MTTRLIALVILVACTTGLLAEEPKLTKATRVFPNSQPAYKRSNQYHAFAMRLSPDVDTIHQTTTKSAPSRINWHATMLRCWLFFLIFCTQQKPAPQLTKSTEPLLLFARLVS